MLYGCTVVQDQCSIVALYNCITSLPVYPSTLDGHCILVLDTSNRCILHCTTLKVHTVYYNADDINDDVTDKYLNAELIFDVGIGSERKGRVVKHAKETSGKPICCPHSNPLFDS